jgi:hypothetical protein
MKIANVVPIVKTRVSQAVELTNSLKHEIPMVNCICDAAYVTKVIRVDL